MNSDDMPHETARVLFEERFPVSSERIFLISAAIPHSAMSTSPLIGLLQLLFKPLLPFLKFPFPFLQFLAGRILFQSVLGIPYALYRLIHLLFDLISLEVFPEFCEVGTIGPSLI